MMGVPSGPESSSAADMAVNETARTLLHCLSQKDSEAFEETQFLSLTQPAFPIHVLPHTCAAPYMCCPIHVLPHTCAAHPAAGLPPHEPHQRPWLGPCAAGVQQALGRGRGDPGDPHPLLRPLQVGLVLFSGHFRWGPGYQGWAGQGEAACWIAKQGLHCTAERVFCGWHAPVSHDDPACHGLALPACCRRCFTNAFDSMLPKAATTFSHAALPWEERRKVSSWCGVEAVAMMSHDSCMHCHSLAQMMRQQRRGPTCAILLASCLACHALQKCMGLACRRRLLLTRAHPHIQVALTRYNTFCPALTGHFLGSGQGAAKPCARVALPAVSSASQGMVDARPVGEGVESLSMEEHAEYR
jgi:hypothetical protein